ncbi:MAG: tetraacyldisaccharide 4'-kinase [Betaproteobacteria bacterium]|nr:tetraacyldisaccharide 4'-kinase [Betaproteobacteria bacterium]
MSWLEPHWQRVTPVSVLLYPLSLLFRAAVAARRAAYRAGLLETVRLPVPVIVVGNIAAGGTGKTPLVLWLAAFLRERGRTPGIVCRGYGGTASGPMAVAADGDPGVCGDEPVLLAQRSGCPVWTGADRVAAGRALLAVRPGCDVIVSDDGLQHYRLARDVEICVVDGERGHGNGWLLPAGPLREPAARLASVHAVVVNAGAGGGVLAPPGVPCFDMRLTGDEFQNLLNPGQRVPAGHFRGKRVHAAAGIGDPRRFFRHLERLGIAFTAHPFPDHHAFGAADLAFPGADAVLMTEKDAVKCLRFAAETNWVLAVDAIPDPRLGDLVLQQLGSVRG